MPSQFASGKHAIAECDVCGFRYKLHELKPLVVKTKVTGILACAACWSPDHPQLQLGMWPVDDPQAIRNPRKDLSYTGPYNSRDIQWGWNPVGMSTSMLPETPNNLVAVGKIGTVVVTIS
jgi:hypothetical protein